MDQKLKNEIQILVNNYKYGDFKKVLSIIRQNQIDLVVVGPEEPLVKGLVDYLNKNKFLLNL